MAKAVLLVGSPKGDRSTSMSLGTYLMDKLGKGGWSTSTHMVGRSVSSITDLETTFADMEGAGLVVLATPLYVDSFPAPVMQFMELYGGRRSMDKRPGPKMALIVNCGFPEDQNHTAVEIARLFAIDTGMTWVGSLSMGQGGAIWGRSLEDLKGRTRRIRSALDRAAASLIEGKNIPPEVERKFSRLVIPTFLYRFMANRGWDASGKRNRAGNMRARPFMRDPSLETKRP